MYLASRALALFLVRLLREAQPWFSGDLEVASRVSATGPEKRVSIPFKRDDYYNVGNSMTESKGHATPRTGQGLPQAKPESGPSPRPTRAAAARRDLNG